MKGRFIPIVSCLVAVAACSSGPRPCEEPGRYITAQEGDPVEVPEDLDNLQPHKELKIPEPSPRPPRPANAGCLEFPPGFESTT